MTESDPAGITLICPDKAPKSIKVQKPIHILHLPPSCSTKSQHFHLPPCYENYQMMINMSLNTANLKHNEHFITRVLSVATFGGPLNKTQLHKLADVPPFPVGHLYKHMIDHSRPILPFNLADESIEDTTSI